MVYVLVSLKREIRFFLSLMQNSKKKKVYRFQVYRGALSGEEVCVVLTGMGKKLPGQAIFTKPGLIVSTGVCGALKPGIKTGDVVISEKLLSCDERMLKKILNGELSVEDVSLNNLETCNIEEAVVNQVVDAVKDVETSVHRGVTFTAPAIIRNYREKAALNMYLKVLSVDMEDFYRASLALKLGLPFVSVRVVLDEVRDDIPTFKSGLGFTLQISSFITKLNFAQVCIADALEKIIERIKII